MEKYADNATYIMRENAHMQNIADYADKKFLKLFSHYCIFWCIFTVFDVKNPIFLEKQSIQ
jgi:hypothetical protein